MCTICTQKVDLVVLWTIMLDMYDMKLFSCLCTTFCSILYVIRVLYAKDEIILT
jgi:hypothetical protein